MKRFILSLFLAFIMSFSFAQAPKFDFSKYFDFNKYEVVDSLPIEYVYFHMNKEINDERLVSLGSGYYMAKVPYKDNMIIRKTSDNTKAIVVYNSYSFGHHFEFNIEETDRRTILWFKNKYIYCGYIYDKKLKVCKYFESKKEFKYLIKN